MPEEFLRLLLGGVGWGLGTLYARQGDTLSEVTLSHEDNCLVLDVFVVCANVIVDFAV